MNKPKTPRAAAVSQIRKYAKAEVRKILPFRGLLQLPGELEPIPHPPTPTRGYRWTAADSAQVKPAAPPTANRDLAQAEEK